MFGEYTPKAPQSAQGSVIGAETSSDGWWKRDESQARQFIGSGEDVFIAEKAEYYLPECQC